MVIGRNFYSRTKDNVNMLRIITFVTGFPRANSSARMNRSSVGQIVGVFSFCYSCNIYYVLPSAKEVVFLCVCLFIFQQDNSKSYRRILMIFFFGGGM